MTTHTISYLDGQKLIKQDGSFIGHAAPGILFLSFGMAGLVISLCRARRLPAGQSFRETYVPEKNKSILKGGCLLLLFCTVGGIVGEGSWTCYLLPKVLAQSTGLLVHVTGCFFLTLPHQVLYCSYALLALIGLLEVYKYLPPDSIRCSLIITLLITALLWQEHASMKTEDTISNRFHSLLAQVTFVHALVVTFSVIKPNNLVVYVAQFGMYVIQGLWMVTIGWYIHNKNNTVLSLDQVGPTFVMQSLIVYLSIIIIGSCCNGQPSYPHSFKHHQQQ